MLRKQIKKKIFGKNRVIRNIVVDEENHLEGYYKNHWFKIEIETKKRYRYADYEDYKTCYIWCTAPDGCYIYDGYASHGDDLRYQTPFTIDEALEDVLENILWEERPER